MTPWTPRPPHPDEPACWSWPVPPVQDYDTAKAAIMADGRFDADSADLLLAAGLDWHRFGEFHEGRCAACAARWDCGVRVVEDHCHETGQVRGMLCHGCNVAEGKRAIGNLRITRYRLLHPAKILDVHMPYTGRDWYEGWWGREARLAEFGELPTRPPTPWSPVDLAAAVG